ncbi:turripeptide Pal9.2-like isoform X2 [Hydractinia symbiolongicarpus]|uniref:turripeptide Pal9.2-like isoform X2 n=1 Tax=Hydractinia symbiolongicarpus TaxID=13093 RepID=UPI00254D8B59|nr:turripeptide Pal9.2-like isoform X2 [Hydractinia symbiolongicarpus]
MKCFIKLLKRDSVFDMKKIYLFCIFFSLAGFAIGRSDEKCSRGCPFNYELVCASNGQSYDNICLMELAACESKTELHVVKHGKCDGES